MKPLKPLHAVDHREGAPGEVLSACFQIETGQMLLIPSAHARHVRGEPDPREEHPWSDSGPNGIPDA